VCALSKTNRVSLIVQYKTKTFSRPGVTLTPLVVEHTRVPHLQTNTWRVQTLARVLSRGVSKRGCRAVAHSSSCESVIQGLIYTSEGPEGGLRIIARVSRRRRPIFFGVMCRSRRIHVRGPRGPSHGCHGYWAKQTNTLLGSCFVGASG
jgi:hypothetical protein